MHADERVGIIIRLTPPGHAAMDASGSPRNRECCTKLLNMRNSGEPVQSDVPGPGLTSSELARDILSRIDKGNTYARSRKKRFRSRSSTVRMLSLVLSVASTIILGLQTLNAWTGVAFALVATVTTVNTLEPFFAWRDRWVLMEETQYRFYRLRDELTYYIAANKPDHLDEGKLREIFDEYQRIWDQLGSRWMEYRRAGGRGD